MQNAAGAAKASQIMMSSMLLKSAKLEKEKQFQQSILQLN
jgi:hypothetical protein